MTLLVAEGLSIIFISHKLAEVLRVSHRIAVLRNGKLVATIPAADAERAKLAHLMVGRDVPAPVAKPRAPGHVVCEMRGVHVDGALDDVTLSLRAGEITAIAGVSGNGQQALADVLFGMRAPDAGSVRVGGRELAARPAHGLPQAWRAFPRIVTASDSWGRLPSGRTRWPTATARDLRTGRGSGASARGAMRATSCRGSTCAAGRGIDTPAQSLSGGNMQKLILGRALATDLAERPPPVLVVADQPTWGLDVGAVAFVHQQLIDACARGGAVLLISDDLDEIYALADRIAVIHDGRLTEAKPRAAWDLSSIGLAMAGRENQRMRLEARRGVSRGVARWPRHLPPSRSRSSRRRSSWRGPARPSGGPTR